MRGSGRVADAPDDVIPHENGNSGMPLNPLDSRVCEDASAIDRCIVRGWSIVPVF
jgi:hypothetical protein